MKILVVDDSNTQRKIIIQALRAIGYDNFIEAENGLDAYIKVKTNTIHLILSDWNMPILNGLELAILLRGNEQYANIPIIIITTRGETKDVIEALKHKINNYIVKPFSPLILQNKIDETMKKFSEERIIYSD